MNWKRTVSFVVVLAVLVSFYFLKLYKHPSADRLPIFSTEAAQSYVLELGHEETVNHLRIQDESQKTSISFEKTDNRGWQITSPVQFPAESPIVDGFVILLKLTPRLRHLSIEGLNPKEFGLDKPQFKICVGTSARKDRCLVVGGKSVIGEGAYAKWEDEPTYFLVDQTFLKAFDKSLYTVRKKQIFTLLDDQISAVSFESSKKQIEIIHQDKLWTLAKPVESAIGPQAVDSLLTELGSLYVKEFLDDEKPAALKSKFSKPARTIRIRFKNGSEQILAQGREAGGRDAYYARLSEPETIFLISRGKLDRIEDAFSSLGT